MHRRSHSEVPSQGGSLRNPISADANRSQAASAGRFIFNIGDLVEVQDKQGTIRFDGTTEFSHGRWVGIELTRPEGKNDGSVQGKRYFECREKYGMFVRPSQVKLINSNAPSETRRRVGSLSSRHGTSPSLSNIPDRVSRVAEIRARLSKVDNKRFPTTDDPAPAVVGSPEPLKNSLDQPPIESVAKEEEIDSEEKNENDEEQSLNFAPAALVERSDQMVPFRQYEELRIRMRVLEAKRQEDIAKWAKFEKIRNEVEQFRILRKRMSEKLKEFHDENTSLRHVTKELRKEKELFEEKLAENEIQIETLTVDREIAEEKAEYLQHNLDTLKDKMDEAAFIADGSMVTTEAIGNKVEEGYDVKAAKEILDLQSQNERLKTALLRYREVASQNENQLRGQLRQAEEDAATQKQFKDELHSTKAKLAQAQDDLEMLQSRLEDFNSAEEMIETLTQQNLNYHDKVVKMTKDIEELEALKEVSDELEETHIENNRQLIQEIDHKDVLIRDLQRRVDSQQEAIADHAHSLNQYRELVGSLQEDLQHVQQQAQNQLNETQNLQSQSYKMLSLNSSLQSQVIKAQAKTIDLELRKLDALQASEHLKCIEPYLPESFFKKENDAIRILLQLKRLVFKANLMGSHLCDQYPIKSLNSLVGGIPEELMVINDLATSSYEFRYQLTELARYGNLFISYLTTCSVGQFLGMSALHHDLTSIERKFDGYLHAIKSEDFVPSQHLQDIINQIASLAHLSETHLAPDLVQMPYANAQMTLDNIKSLTHGSDLFNIKLALIYRALTNPGELNLNLSSVPTQQDKSSLVQDILRPIAEVLKEHMKIRVLAKRAMEIYEDYLVKNSHLDQSIQAKLNSCKLQHGQLVSFGGELAKKLIQYLQDKQSNQESASSMGLQKLIYDTTHAHLQANEVAAFDATLRFITDLDNQLKDMVQLLSSEANFSPYKPKTAAPWVERSYEFKKEIMVNTAAEQKLISLNKDIVKLMDEVRAKDQTLGEKDLKIELLDSRMTKLNESLEKANEFQVQLKQAQHQEKLYLEAVDKLQTENQSLEIENVELRQALAEPAPLENINTNSSPASNLEPSTNLTNQPSSTSLMNNMYQSNMDPRLEVLAKRVAMLSDTNLRHKASHIALDLQFDPVHQVVKPNLYSKPSNITEALYKATSCAVSLNRELTSVLAKPKILNPTATYTELAKALPHLAQNTLLKTYAHRAEKVQGLWQDAHSKATSLHPREFQQQMTTVL